MVVPLVAACYTYEPIEYKDVRPKTDVRVRVSAAAADRIAPLMGGASIARVLSGTVVDTTGGAMIVEVPTVSQVQAGGYVETLHQRVSIARPDVIEVESRTLNRVRTGAVAGSAAIVAGSAVFKAFHSTSGKETPPNTGGNDGLVPLARRIP